MATTTPTVAGTSRRTPWLLELYRSSMGKKYAMAITGVMMLGFVFAHMIGNLKLYLPAGADGTPAIDHYGEFLREGLLVPILPEYVALWILRIGLILALVVHVHAAWALTVANRRARPESYRSRRNYQVADFAGRSMRWTGVIVLLYIGYHLADITLGVQPAAPLVWEYGEVRANMIASMSRPAVGIFYLVANAALGVHLYHGVWSLFQTFGVGSVKGDDWRRAASIGFVAIVLLGNLSFPIAIMTGIVS
jgi:succinate dehydrogenase / fumarate reductase cytochrome b subunit